MNSSTDLHQLIRSMSMSEKRFFKIYSSRHPVGGKNNYLRLFDAIGNQAVYDEARIKNKFRGETFIRHLPSEKNYLYSQVLSSLNAFNRDKTSLSRHAANLTSIEILYNRGLFAQCRKLVLKAKKDAVAHERFTTLQMLLRWETLLYIKDEDEANLDRNLENELTVMNAVQVQTRLMRVAFTIQVQIDKGELTVPKAKANEKKLCAQFPSPEKLSSFWAKYYYHSTLSLLNAVQKKQAQRYRAYEAIRGLMESAPDFIRELPHIYHINSNNLVNILFLLGKYGEVKSIIGKQRVFLKTYSIARPVLERQVFINTAESELFLYYKTGRVEEGSAFARSIEQDVRKIPITFSPLLFDLYFMLAVTELLAKNYKAAVKWLNRILNAEREVNFRMELKINARLLYLVVMHETEDVLLESRIASTKRFVAQEPQFRMQQKIPNMIRVLSDESLLKKNRAKMRKQVTEIQRESRRMSEESLNKLFDFGEWMRGRMDKK
jgi:tetratricopeptide (TPR) repeat protein